MGEYTKIESRAMLSLEIRTGGKFSSLTNLARIPLNFPQLRWRARLISSGSSMPFLIRYPWRLKKLISWADNRFMVTNEVDMGGRLK